jgi:DNA-binding FadR family transcriptional regulator
MGLGHSSEFLDYLAKQAFPPGTRLPSIQDLAKDLGISTGKLREQLEVARQLGLVEIRPKTGTRVLAYDFFQTLRTSLLYAIALDENFFYQFGVLRNNIEASFWKEAVQRLHAEDKLYLAQLLEQAWDKLNGTPIQIPHYEHRQLHMTIYSRLENVFVVGILEAYWDAYESIGLNVYEDYAYLQSVWTYHGDMVRAIQEDDDEGGYRALIEHTGLLQIRPEISMRQASEK